MPIKVFSPQSKVFIDKGKDGKFESTKGPQGAIVDRTSKPTEPTIMAINRKKR